MKIDMRSLWGGAKNYLFLALAIFVTGYLGLLIPTLNYRISLFWLPTGIGIAALTWFGPRMGLAMWLGSFTLNFVLSSHLVSSCVIATGSTLGILITHFFLRAIGFKSNFFSGNGINILAIIVSGLGMIVSALVGTASLIYEGHVPSEQIVEVFKAWWMGDFLGVLLAAPLLLSISKDKFQEVYHRSFEFFGLLLLTAITTKMALYISNEIIFVSVTFLLVTLAIFRLGQLGASIIVLFVAASIIWVVTISSQASPIVEHDVFIAWSYMACISAFNIFLSDIKESRDRATNELSLNHERLIQAQKISHIGSWELNLLNNKMTFSKEYFQIFEIDENTDQ
ncbi:MAG: MASE1 domain-containing protein [Bacteriovoracaceae bacterium]|nr:MASE1 domain-containing protein [Bacteriovoracaceae bacterium]